MRLDEAIREALAVRTRVMDKYGLKTLLMRGTLVAMKNTAGDTKFVFEADIDKRIKQGWLL